MLYLYLMHIIVLVLVNDLPIVVIGQIECTLIKLAY